MFGTQCFGIDVPQWCKTSIPQLMVDILSELKSTMSADWYVPLEWNMSQDNMGLGMIYYFQRLQWPKEVEV